MSLNFLGVLQAVHEISPKPLDDWMGNEILEQSTLFTENHKDLVVEGEKWLKDMANSSAFVGALIVSHICCSIFMYTYGPIFNKNVKRWIQG